MSKHTINKTDFQESVPLADKNQKLVINTDKNQIHNHLETDKPLKTNSKNTVYKAVSLSIVCMALILISANMRSPITVIGSIAPILKQALQIGETHIGFLGAIPVFIFALSALFSARISNRFGIHNVLPLMIGLLFVGMVFRVIMVNWWVFLLGTILLSVAIGFLNTLAMPAIKKLAPNNISLVTGLYSLNMTIFAGLSAGVIVPISEQFGWRYATASWSLISIFGFLVWLFLRPYLMENKQETLNEKLDDNLKSNEMPYQDSSVWKSPLAWHLATFFGIQSLIYYLAASFLPSIWIEKGLSITQAGHIAMLFQLMSPIAILLLIWLMNRAEKTKSNYLDTPKSRIKNYPRVIALFAAIIITLGSAGMAYGTLSSYTNSELLNWATLCTVLMGFGASLIFTLCLMLISLRTHNVQQAGELSGMAQSIAYTIAIFGPLTAGWLHEITGNWNFALTLLTILMAINIIFAWTASRPMMVDGQKIS